METAGECEGLSPGELIRLGAVELPDSPIMLGIKGYPNWRKGQRDLVNDILQSPMANVSVVAPTGSGKSLVAMAVARAYVRAGGRALILTSTRQLQDQIQRDFGVYTLKGMSNYKCLIEPKITPVEAACRVAKCEEMCRCDYFVNIRNAPNQSIICTNYALALLSLAEGRLGEFDVIICDEAHDIVEWVIKNITVEIAVSTLKKFGIDPETLHTMKAAVWVGNACGILKSIVGEEEQSDSHSISPARIEAKRLLTNLSMVNPASPGFVWELDNIKSFGVRSLRITDTDTAGHAYRMLTGLPGKKVFLSATNRMNSMISIGVTEGHEIQVPSGFPVERRPVYFIPTVKIDYKSGDADLMTMVRRIDEIISEREDVSGLIQTGSYGRAQYIAEHSTYRQRMITHKRGEMAKGLKKFLANQNPSILLSPAATTGVDLPHGACRFQIIPKVPILGGSGPILKARKKSDPEWYNNYTFQTLVQSCGRSMRAEDDWCEMFIIDNNWFWIRNKIDQYAPEWFIKSVKQRTAVPRPLGRKFGNVKAKA